jgi:hypothetical protein
MSRADFDVVPIKGEYRIRQAGRRRDNSHGTFGRAEAAALRLAEANPGAEFIITQEIARVCPRGAGGR